MNYHEYELLPEYDTRKSFHGRAKVLVINPNHKELYSFTTLVATIRTTPYYSTVEVHSTYSPTTLRHIKEFLKQHGFKAESKSQIEEDYMNLSN